MCAVIHWDINYKIKSVETIGKQKGVQLDIAGTCIQWGAMENKGLLQLVGHPWIPPASKALF